MSDDFKSRQEANKSRINALDHERLFTEPRRDAFFETVYQMAEGDAALVPWADLQAKDKVLQWLEQNPDHTGRAIDVGCGLGDNAIALENAGYETTAFDFSSDAIEWAKKRFSDFSIEFHVQDLFDLPAEWSEKFDLVHECYTLQSIPPETLDQSIPAVAGLVAKGGILLVYARVREDGEEVSGPPWPLEKSRAASFADYGLELLSREYFHLEKPGRQIPHEFSVWRRPA